MNFSICGQNNCTRCTKGGKKKSSDLFLLRTTSGKRGEIKGVDGACSAVCGFLQIVWMKRHSCLSCLIISSPFSISYSFTIFLVTPSLYFICFSLILPCPSLFYCLTSLFSSFSLLSFFFFFLCHMFAQLPRLPFPPPGLGSVASNAFHSA